MFFKANLWSHAAIGPVVLVRAAVVLQTWSLRKTLTNKMQNRAAAIAGPAPILISASERSHVDQRRHRTHHLKSLSRPSNAGADPSVTCPATRECADRMQPFQKEGIPGEGSCQRQADQRRRFGVADPGNPCCTTAILTARQVPPEVDPWGAELQMAALRRCASDDKGGLRDDGLHVRLKRQDALSMGFIHRCCRRRDWHDAGTVWLIKKGKIKADHAIVGEPTFNSWRSETGVLWVEITIIGKGSHAGRPHLGINAVHNAARAIIALDRLEFPDRDELFEVPNGSVSVTMIQGGTKINTLADRCTISIDRRMMPSHDVEEALEQIRQTVAGSLEEGADFDMKVLKVWPPVMMDPDHILVKTVADAFESVHGFRPKIRAKAGGTDASVIKGMLGVPIVLHGPAVLIESIMANEYVNVDELVNASQVYTLATLKLCLKN